MHLPAISQYSQIQRLKRLGFIKLNYYCVFFCSFHFLVLVSNAAADIIFETDFSQDTGYFVSSTNLWNGGSSAPVSPPTGWDGVKASQGSSISVVAGAGVNNSNALKIEWSPDAAQPTASLGKHLTGNVNTGYEDVYIRYHVRLPNKFKVASNGYGIEHWKWGRLWQNTNTDNSGNTHHWTENRTNSGFVVWNFNSNIPYTDVNVAFAENSGKNHHLGSSGGAHQLIDFFVSGSDPHTAPGYFESVWDINTTSRPGELENNTSQQWHTIEFRFKLATTATSDDGIFEMWFDGVNQGHYSRILPVNGAVPGRSGIPTTNKGSGFNFFTLFDNLQGWNAEWHRQEVDGFIYINDIVISTSRIGHEYEADSGSGGEPPSPVATIPDYQLQSGKWQQLVIPGNSANLSIEEMFADDLHTADYNETWAIFLWDAAAKQYVNPGLTGTIPVGQGFWIIQLTGSEVVLDVNNLTDAPVQTSVACLSNEGCTEIPLVSASNDHRFNMLGSALPKTLDMSNVQLRTDAVGGSCSDGCTVSEAIDLSLVDGSIWRYDPGVGGYVDLTPSGILQPWESFWIETLTPLGGIQAETLFSVTSP